MYTDISKNDSFIFDQSSFQIPTIDQKLKIASGRSFHKKMRKIKRRIDVDDVTCGSILIAPVTIDCGNANNQRGQLGYRLLWRNVDGPAFTCLRMCGRLIASSLG